MSIYLQVLDGALSLPSTKPSGNTANHADSSGFARVSGDSSDSSHSLTLPLAESHSGDEVGAQSATHPPHITSATSTAAPERDNLPGAFHVSGLNRARFWTCINRNGPIPPHVPEIGRCWEWIRAKCPDGYGRMRVGDRVAYSHRVSWAIHFGQPPLDRLVCHKCNNPACVNPAHLFLGTNQENCDDKVRKNRQSSGKRGGRRKLTGIKVDEIKALCSAGATHKSVASKFGVCRSTVDRIVAGKIWKPIRASLVRQEAK